MKNKNLHSICFLSAFVSAFLWVFCLHVERAYAVPACPTSVEVTQPNGIKFLLRLQGDEHFSWNETEEGYAVVKDSTDGFWKYAKPAAGQAAFEIIPNAIVGESAPASLNLQKSALPDAAAIRQRIENKQKETKGLVAGTPAMANLMNRNAATPAPSEPPTEPAARIPVSGTKTIKNIVILACFSDHWNSSASTVLSSKGRINTTEYANLFNEIGHSNDGAVGSVKDYYREVSYGKLTIDSVVTAWVQLPQNEAYYGANGSGLDANAGQMTADAINAAAAASFDFSQGDSDGDGWVDCLTIIHSGFGEEYGGNPANCIWSHQGEMSSVATTHSVNMKRYHTEPALRGAAGGTSITRIGVVCHEMGHFFGLPDLYDYSAQTNGLGSWCIMAGGCWNGGTDFDTIGKRPAHFSAWPKVMLGFAKSQQIHSQSTISLPRVEDNAVVHMLRDGMSNGEYFLVENRALTGFDNSSSICAGLVIYHVDSKSVNNDLGTWAHPVVKIEEGDGNNSLGAKTAASEAGDVWTTTNGLAGGFRDQTGYQSANAMLYQSAAYNRADNSSYYSYIHLTNFSDAAGTMTYTVSTLKPAVSNQVTSSGNYTVSWGACTSATAYEIQEGSPVTLTSFSDGAEIEDDMHENWYLGGTVLRDTGGAQSGSYSYAMHQYYGGKFYSKVQSLTLRNAFKLTSSTVVSFYLMSHLYSGDGYLQCQISNDSGNTWETLGAYSGYIDPWSQRTYDYAAINALGINANEMCILRFVADFEWGYGWAPYPGYGYALDDISITGAEIASHDNWTTLSSSVSGNSYGVTGRNGGIHSYRVQAYANSAWQGFGSVGTATVPPVNDNFASATTISSATGTMSGSNIYATKESSEPNHAGNSGGKSVWWRWTAPANGSCAMDTHGSDFDTLLAAYTGSSVNALTEVASNNDDPGYGGASKVTFTAQSGVTYKMAVDGFGGASGSLLLSWNFSPTTGSLTVTISPADAVSSGAQWHVRPLEEAPNPVVWHDSGTTAAYVPGAYTLVAKAIPGWATPGDQSVTITESGSVNKTLDYGVPLTPILIVASKTPNSGVSITVSPLDNAGQGNGVTQFTRTYNYNTTVTLTAVIAAPNGNLFYRWLIDGAEFAGNQSRTVQVLMNTTRTMTAIYHSDRPTLTVASQNPDNGVNIFLYPADATGKTRGTTQFTCQYLWRSLPTLTAPPSLPNGWLFSKWLKDGANFPYNTYRDVLCSMDTDHTMTAVFAHPYNTSLLTVASSNPLSGAFVSVYPADKFSRTSGTTQFVCSYVPNSMVTLTARGTAPNGYVFSKWLKDGGDFPNNSYRDVLCSMATDHTMTAIYARPYNTALLTVASSSPVSGAFVSVYPADKYNQTTGTTQFVCSYVPNSMITLTARGNAPNGYVFWKWLRDGADFPNNTYRDVLCSMGSDHTMTAVYKP